MRASPEETERLRKLIHDVNGRLFLIRGHVEIARRTDCPEQHTKSMDQIKEATDDLERFMRALRADLCVNSQH